MLEKYIQKIEEALNAMHETMSYEEMSKRLGVAPSTLSGMLNSSRPIKNPSLDLLLKVFPHAEIHLEGAHNTSIADNGGVSVQDISVSGGNNNFFSKEKESIKKITDAVMTSDLDPESKVKVYNIIKENSEG